MKQVSNEEFLAAFNNEIYRKIINAASKKYKSILGEEVEVCKLDGLWLALRDYENARGMTFTTYLFESVKRKCFAEAKRVRRKNKKERNFSSLNMPENTYHDDYLMNDIALSLNERDAKLLSDRFIYNKTLLEIGNEYDVSFQAIDQRLHTLTKKIKRILTE